MNAQRKSLSIKPVVAAPKSQYSMQDLLHEKQKHIEQLMIERELDREDCQNQALQYQKNINEVIIYEDALYAPVVYADKKRPFRLTRQQLPTIPPRPSSHSSRGSQSPSSSPAKKRSSLVQQWTYSRSPTPPTKRVWFWDTNKLYAF
uniref:Restin n=2 Tax=Bactrocera latifrons TaxID=174628 RepID=A0A0K8UUB1_BACLA